MKKICFITTVPGTLKSFVLKTAKYIHENTDWDISFICDYDEEFAQNLPDYIHYFPVKMQRGVSIAGIRAMFEMKKIFKREKFDLIDYTTPNASLYAAMAGKLSKIAIRLYSQGGIRYLGFNGIKFKIFKTIEKITCKLSTHIRPVSNSNLEYSVSQSLYCGEKGKVIWNGSACGVDLKKFDISQKEKYRAEIREKYNLKDSDFVFGFVGRITRDKGINELFFAFKEIIETNPNAYLMMVGRPELDKTVNKELFDWARYSKNVIFTGYTTTVEKYLSAMDTFVFPSYREGFGLVVIEAEAMGVPVIVTDIPGPIDAMVKDKTGLIVSKKDIVSLQNAMQTLINNPETVTAYGKEGVQYVQNNFEQQQLFEHILLDRKKLLSEC